MDPTDFKVPQDHRALKGTQHKITTGPPGVEHLRLCKYKVNSTVAASGPYANALVTVAESRVSFFPSSFNKTSHLKETDVTTPIASHCTTEKHCSVPPTWLPRKPF